MLKKILACSLLFVCQIKTQDLKKETYQFVLAKKDLGQELTTPLFVINEKAAVQICQLARHYGIGKDLSDLTLSQVINELAKSVLTAE
jgi:hypothetical protein